LALLALCPEATLALNERHIQLAHAELLCALDPAKQKEAVAKIIEHKLSVDYVRQYITKFAQTLTCAIFDKAECESCAYNSTRQRALFTEAVAEGHCTNTSCYESKTQAALESLRQAAAEEVPKALIIGPGEEGLFIPLLASGERGVGAEQYEKGCRACANFGCAVMATPQRMGEIEKELCFDLSCNQKMIAARIKSEQASEPPAPGAKPRTTTAKPAKTKVGTVPKAVIEYRRGIWRNAAKKELVASPAKARAYGIALAVSGKSRDISQSVMQEIFKKLADQGDFAESPTTLDKIATLIEAQTPEVVDKLTTAMAVAAIRDSDGVYLMQTLDFLKVDMAAHWELCADFLKLMTKAEIEAVCAEIGLKAFMGADFGKAIAKKKDESIAALLKVPNFEYAGKIPSSMQYQAA